MKRKHLVKEKERERERDTPSERATGVCKSNRKNGNKTATRKFPPLFFSRNRLTEMVGAKKLYKREKKKNH